VRLLPEENRDLARKALVKLWTAERRKKAAK